jgi:tol-pal system protein YbgF
MKTTQSIFILCGLIMLSGCALQEDVIVLEERLITLERQNQALQRKNDTLEQQFEKEFKGLEQNSLTSEKNIRSNYANLNVNIDNIQQEIRELNGRVEELDYRINRQIKEVGPISQKVDELSITTAKVDQRMTRLEQYLNFDGSQKPTATAENISAPAPPSSEQKMYDDAKKAFDNGELDKARQGFALLLKTFPQSENADNAQFWIGESYFREKWYEKAILEYQSVLEKYPNGNKVPAAMLKQGLAFLNLGDKSNARLILKELQKKYPTSNEARIAGQKLSEF